MLDKFLKHLYVIKNLWLDSIIHQAQILDTEGGLQTGPFIEPIKTRISIGILFQSDENSHTRSVRFISDIHYLWDGIFFDLIGNFLNQICLFNGIGYLGDDYGIFISP